MNFLLLFLRETGLERRGLKQFCVILVSCVGKVIQYCHCHCVWSTNKLCVRKTPLPYLSIRTRYRYWILIIRRTGRRTRRCHQTPTSLSSRRPPRYRQAPASSPSGAHVRPQPAIGKNIQEKRGTIRGVAITMTETLESTPLLKYAIPPIFTQSGVEKMRDEAIIDPETSIPPCECFSSSCWVSTSHVGKSREHACKASQHASPVKPTILTMA